MPLQFETISTNTTESRRSIPRTGASPSRPLLDRSLGDALLEAAEKDTRIVAITAAMASSTGLLAFAERFPDRFFDVGIAEQHAVTFAAGLAMKGSGPWSASTPHSCSAP